MLTPASERRILIVEDETIVARDIHSQLATLGHNPVGIANTGEQAVALTAALQPDLVLMDIRLGTQMDGIEAAQAIRQASQTPVVFLSAYAADDILQRAQTVEPYGYLLKPFSERELHIVLQMAFYKMAAQQREHALQVSNQTLLDNMTQGVFSLDASGLVLSCNKSACALFGYEPQEIVGHHVHQLLPESVRAQREFAFDAAAPNQAVVCCQREILGLRKNGDSFPVNLSLSPVKGARPVAYIGLISDLSQSRLVEQRVDSLTFFDELTGLPNRRRLTDRLAQAVAAATQSNQQGALIYLDLDHFRHVNDSLGPQWGDRLLRSVAQRLQQCVREGDTVAHFGGDEFMIILDKLGPEQPLAATRAESVSLKILQALSQPHQLNGQPYIGTASIGIVMFGPTAKDTDDLVKRADAAMYQAKAAGRSAVRFYDPALQASILANTELEADLRRGLRAQEFVLHYQLQVDAHGTPLGAEALVRWQHPQRGLVSPGQFIAVAEETGLILPLGQWVLDSACQQLVRWSLVPERAHWVMAVNVSAMQFAQDHFVDSVTMALNLSGACPARLKLELTESMLVGNVDEVIAKMRSLKALGVSFSLDDFGTGYSSLMYLKRLPMDQLKIDQSFVRNLLNDPDDAVISRTIVSLAHNLGKHVIAEGVETPDQYKALLAMGCDTFQGYLFARPCAPEDLPEVASKKNV